MKDTKTLINRTLWILHIFIGVGALAGGVAAISNPNNPMGISAEVFLADAPFKTFLIPGIILFGLIGIGNLVGAGILKKHVLGYEYVSGVCGGALMIWIVVQCIILKGVGILHIIYFLLGVIQGLLVLGLLWEKKWFPMNILRGILKYIKVVK